MALRIAILAAGAAGMYCGSCLRDNHLASALLRAGHKVMLIPLYTPLKTDEPSVSEPQVFYGGVNAWLQYASGVFRHTPRAIDWLFDRPWLLKMAGQYGAQTSPAKLGPFILSMMKGDQGPQLKELRRLVKFLKQDGAPEIVTLPNAMFIGLARMLREELKVPVLCELTGEDIFLDAMAEPYRSEALEIMRQRARDVARFVATSSYYADHMAGYLKVDRAQISVVPPGIPATQIRREPAGPFNRVPTIGYFARVCPEKGLDRLADALVELRRLPGMAEARVRSAGYLGAAHKRWFEELRRSIASRGLAEAFSYEGELDLAGKLAFLDSVDVLCVPTAYAEPKGMYILEALGRGVPVVAPSHGAFPELLQETGGGLLARPHDPAALACALERLLSDPSARQGMGKAGQEAVRQRFTDDHMADKMVAVFQEALK